jgi:hypothetical protein
MRPKSLSYKPAPCHDSGMENIAVNRAERIRYRAFNHYARQGDYRTYWRLVNATLGPIREGQWQDVLSEA